jgi:hypothetical protein
MTVDAFFTDDNQAQIPDDPKLVIPVIKTHVPAGETYAFYFELARKTSG